MKVPSYPELRTQKSIVFSSQDLIDQRLTAPPPMLRLRAMRLFEAN
jgi:hypothetical protein